jgi:hypothetical protein
MRQVHDSVLDELRSRQDAAASTLRSVNAEAQFFKPFSIGDIVWLRNNATVGEHKKLKHDFKQLGPYRITSVLYQSSFNLEHVETKSIRKAHYNQLSMVDPNLQAEYGATTRGEGKAIADNQPTSSVPDISNDLVEPTTTEISDRRVTFYDTVANSYRRLKSPPPTAPKTRVLPTQSSRTVMVEKSKDDSKPTLHIRVPAQLQVPSVSRFGRERRKPAHLLPLASVEEEGGSDVTP